MTTTTKSTPKKFNFTVKALDALKAPSEGRYYVYDARTPALALCITVTNKRTFYLYRRVQGKPQRILLGTYPPLTIEQARDLANVNHASIAFGNDPNAAKALRRQEKTLGEVWQYYLEKHLIEKHSPRTVQSDTSRWQWLEPWAERKMSTITAKEVSDLHAKIGREGAP